MPTSSTLGPSPIHHEMDLRCLYMNAMSWPPSARGVKLSWPRSFAEAHGSPDKFGRRSGTVVSQFIGRWGGRPSLEGAMACLENAPHLLALCVQSAIHPAVAEDRRLQSAKNRVVDGREAAETEPSSPEEPWFQPGLRFFSPGFLVAGDECAPEAVAQQRDNNGVAQQTRGAVGQAVGGGADLGGRTTHARATGLHSGCHPQPQ